MNNFYVINHLHRMTSRSFNLFAQNQAFEKKKKCVSCLACAPNSMHALA